MIIMNIKRLCYGFLLVIIFCGSLIIGVNHFEASNKTTAEITIQSDARIISDSSKGDYRVKGDLDSSKSHKAHPPNPVSRLLQTNEKNSWFLIFLGIILIIFVIWKKKKKK